ncbi:MAG: hypothetical protein ACLPWD_07440 [Methanobacterium sp.]
MNILPEEAKIIAQKYIKEPEASAGKPELKNLSGKQIYIIPVILNNKIVGEIHIDPEKGENVGGAGGASNG